VGEKVAKDARTMPVDCVLHIQVVEDGHLQSVALICLDQRPGLLAVDQVDVASKAICQRVSRVGEGCAERCLMKAGLPGERGPLCSVRL